MKTLLESLRRYFVSGVLVVVPVILSYLVIKFLFQTIDGVLRPALHGVLGYFVPGLGVVTTLLLIILAGVLTRNYVGHRIYRMGDRLLARLPVIRPIYSAAKQLLEAMTSAGTESFKEVGLVVYPRRGSYALCFISRRLTVHTEEGPRQLVTVFVPSTPTPVSGMVIIVPPEDVTLLDMTVEEGIKFLVSGGVASPETLRARMTAAAPDRREVVNEAG